MSQSGPSIDSRPSLTNSEIEPRPAISISPPTVEERAAEFYDTYPNKADQPLFAVSADDPREAYATGPRLRLEVVRGSNGGDTFSLTWGGAVRRYLEYCEERREAATGRFEDPVDGEPFEVPFLPHSFHPDYLGRDYARLCGLAREIDREYQDPGTALLALTASGRAYGGPVDHLLDRRAAWGPTLDALRYVMERAVDEGRVRRWMWVVVEEHHQGGTGGNAGLGHEHPYVIFDGELDAEDFRPVISAWVDNCEGAGRKAHRINHPDPEKAAVVVKDVDPDADQDGDAIRRLGSYLTKYLHPDEGEELPIERPIERVMYEAVKWSTNTQRLRKADVANRAIKADLCHQRAERVDARADHGERLTHADGRGPEIVCAECGSGWGVDPDAGTIVDARRPDLEPATLTAIILPDGSEVSPSGGGVRKRAVLGWDWAPKGLPSRWRGCDKLGRSTEGTLEETEQPPPVDRFGRVWDRPPPGGDYP